MTLISSLLVATILSAPSKIFAHGMDHRVDDGEIFSHYSLFEIINPILLFGLVALYFVYIKVLKQQASQRSKEITRKNKLYVALGLATIYISLAGPLAILANNMSFTAHMAQQSLMYIVMPPLVLLGIPGWFMEPALKKVIHRPAFKILNNPLVSIFSFNFLWSIYHLPVVFEFLLSNEFLMLASHGMVIIAAFLMWIHVIPPVKELNRLSDLQKIAYMYANGLLITPACALIIFSGQLLYPSLLMAPEAYSSYLGPLFDQRSGGVVMKVVQEFSYGSIIGYIFFRWVRRERKQEKDEGLVTPNLSYIHSYEQK